MKKREIFKIEGDKISRLRRHCPKCGDGIFLAEHKDRLSCGNCGYTEFKGGMKKSPVEKPAVAIEPEKKEEKPEISGEIPAQEEKPSKTSEISTEPKNPPIEEPTQPEEATSEPAPGDSKESESKVEKIKEDKQE